MTYTESTGKEIAMPLKPLDFFILTMTAIRCRRLERELEAEVLRELAEDGLLNPDGSLNVEAIIASSKPLDWSEYYEEAHPAPMAD